MIQLQHPAIFLEALNWVESSSDKGWGDEQEQTPTFTCVFCVSAEPTHSAGLFSLRTKAHRPNGKVGLCDNLPHAEGTSAIQLLECPGHIGMKIQNFINTQFCHI